MLMDDPNPKNEEYYLARPIEPATRLAKGGLHCGNSYMRGWWVTTIKWFELEAVLPGGERRYKLKKSSAKGEVFSSPVGLWTCVSCNSTASSGQGEDATSSPLRCTNEF